MRIAVDRAFHLLASKTSEVFTFLDERGVATYQSPSAREVLGYEPEDLVGTNVFEMVHPDDRVRVRGEMQSLLAAWGTTERTEVRFRHADGSWRDFAIVSINALDDPELRCVVCVSRDVTERKRVERELRRADSQLRSLVGGLPLIAYACDMDGRFTYSDGGGLAKLGVAPGEAVGMNAFELYADIPAFVDALRRGLAGEPVRYVSKAEGAVFDNLHAPYFDGHGQQIGVVGLAIDITERSELEADLARAQRLDAIGRLAGGVAHDFNNLLTVILGNAQLALAKVRPGTREASSLEHIVTGAQQASELTQQLLAFARKQRVEPRRTDVTELVRGTADMLRHVVGSDRSYDLSLDALGAVVMVDPGQLEQVLVNLVLNARDAVSERGGIAIRVRRVAPAERPADLPAALTDADLVVIEVADSGVGIDPESLDHIFEPFYTTKGGTGTGLGLASSLGIVRQAGGDLQVESAPGAGSIFRVFLPLVDEPVQGATAPAESAGEGGGDETLLLVEDHAEVGDVAAAALAAAGYTVLRAAHGEEALALLAGEGREVAAVVTDLVMPTMGGRELARRLREERPELPVLFTSGYDTEIGALPLGPRARFLPKPFRPRELQQAVRALLDGAGDDPSA